MRTGLFISFAVMMTVALPLAAQVPVGPKPTAPPGPTSATSPVPKILPLPPIDQRPEALLQAQQLALSAYPELRKTALQVRVEDDIGGLIMTYAEAGKDGEDLMASTRLRPALLVIETTFDATHVLTRAVLRGSLAHSGERRRIQALTTDWSGALDRDGAEFSATNQSVFVSRLDLDVVKPLLGSVMIQSAHLQVGPEQEGLYWQVTATTPSGQSVTLGFEPYLGRLVRIVKGGVK